MRMLKFGWIGAFLIVATTAAVVSAQTNSQEIMAKPEAELIEILKNPNATNFEKAKASQRLAVIGTKAAIPALATMLPDQNMNVYARFGLEGIQDSAVDDVLRDAATKLQGSQLIGVIDSIGQRRDAKAAGLLKGLLSNADPTVVSIAAGALGQIGTPEAAAALQEAVAKKSPAQKAIADGCLIGADRLAADGRKAEAVALLEAVDKTDLPVFVKTAALGGRLRILQGDAKDLLLAQVRNPDQAYFDLGLSYARQIPGAAITAALTDELKNLAPERQALLLRALADRQEPAPTPAVMAAAKSESPEVREAAIYVLAKYGDASAAAILLDAALGDAAVAQSAKDGLKNLPGQEVDAAILARLAGADAKKKSILFDILAVRRIAAAAPAVREALADGDELVRLAALAALGHLAELNDIDLLAGKALDANQGNANETNAAKSALQMAVLRMSDRDACAAKLAAGINGASDENRDFLLALLGKMSGPKALEIVIANVKSDNPATKDAATRVLGAWLNADAAPALLDIVKNDPDGKYQTRALRGYIRIARQLQLPAETKLAMFKTVMETAKREQEKQLALDILTRIPSSNSIAVAVSYLGQPELKNAAATAAVKIAGKLVSQDPKAVADAMQKVVDAGVPDDLANRAKHLLGQAQAAGK